MRRRPLPGDLAGADLRARALRVDHAGELAAVRILEGQLAVLGDSPAGAPIREMAAQERLHLETFERLIARDGVRPTVLAPLWRAAGFALGVAGALAGPRAAMACTAAIEETIEAHYARQIAALEADPDADRKDGGDGETGGEETLSAVLRAFRDDEIAHRDAARTHGADAAPGRTPLGALVRGGCRAAIRLSERF